VAESIRIALRGVIAAPLRSALTVLGLMIGVAAVILLVAVGNGSSVAVQRQLQALGTDTLTVTAAGPVAAGPGGQAHAGTVSRFSQLTPADVRALGNRAAAPDIAAVAPVASTQATLTYQGGSTQVQQFTGSTPAYLHILNYTVAAGHSFTAYSAAAHQRVVLLGSTVAARLFGAAEPAGKQIRVNGVGYQVIGVLASKGATGAQNQDDVAIAPITAVRDTLTGYGPLTAILAQAASRAQVSAAQAEVSQVLTAAHHLPAGSQPDFQVLDAASLVAASAATNRVFTILLGAVAAISLLVGGIGVMNIMLVTVTERTREIGIRKAIGAQRADILGQFLVEAVLLAALGGAIGAAAGIASSHFRVAGVQPVVVPLSVLLAFAVALAVGLFFGIYPANRAASLPPIQALRHE